MGNNGKVNRVEWLRLSPTDPDEAPLVRAASVLAAGGLVVYPTDTLYGLAADPRLDRAVERVFSAKGRVASRALPLIVASLQQAEDEVARLSEVARRLARHFWPGPLTLVAEARPGLAAALTGEEGSVALRVPDQAVARGLAHALGFAIVSTSANRSGDPAPQTAEEAVEALGERVDLVLDSGPTPGGAPSTIVDARTMPPRLVRAGAVPMTLILQFAGQR